MAFTVRSTVYLLILLVSSVLLPAQASPMKSRSFDLIVYGATPCGIMTAVEASRQGLSVALVDPGHHVGGMVAGGLSSSDVGNQKVIGGLSREFFEKVGQHYNEPIEWHFEPHVAEAVFNEFLQQAKVTTILDKQIREHSGVLKRGTIITSIILTTGETLNAKVFADASYEGDLMAQAGVSYTWGREGVADYGESYAGVRGRQRPDHHFNVRVSPYNTDGSLLPEVYAGPKGTFGQGDKKVQAYGFRMCFTNRKSDMVPFPKPAGYDRYRYELLKRLIVALGEKEGHSPTVREMMIVSPLKGDKFDINSFGAFSTDHIGGSWEYPTGTYEKRAAIWQDHYNYEAGFFYFLANDPGVPAALRDEMGQYGLAKDEFTDTENWPWQLYIRESRRMLGSYIMKQQDIESDVTKPDSIGMGSYPSDSHHMQRIPTPDGGVENEGEMSDSTQPYQIPYRMMLPKSGEAPNLLVPVCFSASHVAYSTIRMEPQYMIIGQAAGVAAALAIHRDVPLADIPLPELRRLLLADHAVLALPL